MTFSERNRQRCESPNGFNHALHSWSLADWICALTVADPSCGNVTAPARVRFLWGRDGA
jgi:hypothetical protein